MYEAYIVNNVEFLACFLISVLELVHSLWALAFLLLKTRLGLAVRFKALLVLHPGLSHTLLQLMKFSTYPSMLLVIDLSVVPLLHKQVVEDFKSVGCQKICIIFDHFHNLFRFIDECAPTLSNQTSCHLHLVHLLSLNMLGLFWHGDQGIQIYFTCSTTEFRAMEYSLSHFTLSVMHLRIIWTQNWCVRVDESTFSCFLKGGARHLAEW